MKPSRGCSGITRHACTQLWATSAPSSLNSSGIEQPKQSQADLAARAKQAMEKEERKVSFPTFTQPRRLRNITQYGIRILRARSMAPAKIPRPFFQQSDIFQQLGRLYQPIVAANVALHSCCLYIRGNPRSPSRIRCLRSAKSV